VWSKYHTIKTYFYTLSFVSPVSDVQLLKTNTRRRVGQATGERYKTWVRPIHSNNFLSCGRLAGLISPLSSTSKSGPTHHTQLQYAWTCLNTTSTCWSISTIMGTNLRILDLQSVRHGLKGRSMAATLVGWGPTVSGLLSKVPLSHEIAHVLTTLIVVYSQFGDSVERLLKRNFVEDLLPRMTDGSRWASWPTASQNGPTWSGYT